MCVRALQYRDRDSMAEVFSSHSPAKDHLKQIICKYEAVINVRKAFAQSKSELIDRCLFNSLRSVLQNTVHTYSYILVCIQQVYVYGVYLPLYLRVRVREQ